MMSRKNQNHTMIGLLFLMMFAVAVLENMVGVIVPQVKEYFELNTTEMSFVFSLGSLAYILGTFISDRVIQKLGYKFSESFAFGLMILGCFAFALLNTYLGLICGIILINIGIAMNGVVLNVSVPLLTTERKAPVILNRLHFMYGIGAMVSKSLMGWQVGQGNTFNNLYLEVGAFLSVLSILFIFTGNIVHQPSMVAENQQNNHLPMEKAKIFLDLKGILLALAIGSYLFSEVGLGNWLVDYLKEGQNISEAFGGKVLAYFYLLLAVGRFFGGKVVEKFGMGPAMVGGGFLGSCFIVFGLFLEGPFYYFISLAGLFFSIIFPTAVVLISQYYPQATSKMTSYILSLTFLMNMGYHLLFGRLVDRFGFNLSIFLIPLSGLIFVGLLYWIFRLFPLDKKRPS